VKKLVKKDVITTIEKPYKVPSFIALDANGDKVTHDSFIDHWNILYFYPKDMTSGCTTQAIAFEAAQKKFAALNCKIIGASKDSCTSHLKFAHKENLSFTLLSDKENNLCELFGVWKEKSMYGKKYMGIERTTFVINPEGMVVAQWQKVKVTGHVEEVFSSLKKLTQQKE
jgi:peroxiredoxin Q/BCP